VIKRPRGLRWAKGRCDDYLISGTSVCVRLVEQMGEPFCEEKERLLRDTVAGLLELVRILELMIAYSSTDNPDKFKELAAPRCPSTRSDLAPPRLRCANANSIASSIV
jgi:hypothetical protein